nr:hypothetical protein [Ralstonia mannitolilytica]
MTPEREAQMRKVFEKWWLEPEGFGLRAERFTEPGEAALAGFFACARALEPMVRDGERYQWLRVNSGYSIRCNLFGETPMYKHKDSDLDEAIDKAMSAALEDGNAEH